MAITGATMVKNNRFTKDDDGDRQDRLDKISAHIDEFQAELGLPPDKLDWAQNCGDSWENLILETSVQRGHLSGLTTGLNILTAEVREDYVVKRKLLETIIDSIDPDEDLKREYGFEGRSPRGYNKLLVGLDRWEDTHCRLVAEGDTRVLPDEFYTELIENRDKLSDAIHEKGRQKRLVADLVQQKKERFRFDINMLRYLFSVCRLRWGPDDPKLKLLGFQTRSGVWSEKKKPEEPE